MPLKIIKNIISPKKRKKKENKTKMKKNPKLFKRHILPNEKYLSDCLSDHLEYIPTFQCCSTPFLLLYHSCKLI